MSTSRRLGNVSSCDKQALAFDKNIVLGSGTENEKGKGKEGPSGKVKIMKANPVNWRSG